MNKIMKCLSGWLIVVAMSCSLLIAGDEPVIAGYFAEWGIYDKNYQVMDIPGDRITHVIYAFAKIEQGEVAVFDSYAALEKVFPGKVKGNFGQLKKLKEKYPHLKTLIAIGGWTASDPFSDAALTDASRVKFARSAARFVEQYGFDGVDIDWEYPCGRSLLADPSHLRSVKIVFGVDC